MRITVTVLAGYFAFALVAPVAEAANRFAMTCIENKTDITLKLPQKMGQEQLVGTHTGSNRGSGFRTPRKPSDGKAPDLY